MEAVDPSNVRPAEPNHPPRFGAIILAAGASVRMGTPKQLLVVGGKTLLARTVEAALGSPVWPLVVVLGASAETIRPVLAPYPVLVAENEAWAEGMASSIRTGIRTLQQHSRTMDGALIALCDQPAFSSTAIQRLIAAQAASGLGIAASRYNGHQGAPALFLREYFPALAALTGEEGARALLNGGTSQVAAVDQPELATDLDTPDDYAAAQRNFPPTETPL